MVNPTGKKLEKLLFGIFDEAIQGVDTYNYKGSMWLIFTDEMRWVVEYTRLQTLWYNYYFFKQEMEIIGLDCVENKDLIQKWFESRFLNINLVENTIQNGVKDTSFVNPYFNQNVEETIQNGVRKTLETPIMRHHKVKDTIQNGVKETISNNSAASSRVEDTIKNGVRHTESLPENNPARIEDVTLNGVKESNWKRVDNFPDYVKGVIENGVKEMQPLPAQDGNRDWGKYYYGKEDRTKPHTEYVKDVIENGIKYC